MKRSRLCFIVLAAFGLSGAGCTVGTYVKNVYRNGNELIVERCDLTDYGSVIGEGECHREVVKQAPPVRSGKTVDEVREEMRRKQQQQGSGNNISSPNPYASH